MIDLFGHLSYAAIFVGMLLLSRESNAGWLVKAVGDGGWVVLGVVMGMSSIITWGAFFVLLDLAGWLAWRQKDVKDLALAKKRLAEGGPGNGAEDFFRSLGL